MKSPREHALGLLTRWGHDPAKNSVRWPQNSEFISPSVRTIMVYQADDSFNIIDLLLVTDMEVKNGRRRQPA